jgi:NAD(P)-dependent dehydrogenase (short-subunit alcohol dehydrogenase family)
VGLLDGKVAVVTGAGRGIGRGHALALAAQGAAVVVCDVGLELRGGEGGQGLEPGEPNIKVAQAVVDEIQAAGGRAVADSTNVGSIAGAGDAVAHAIEEFGDIHIVVNNAGTVTSGTIFDLDDERVDAEFATHLKGTMGTTKAAVNAMKAAGHGGSIINTLTGGFGGGGENTIYATAKAAIASFTLATAGDGAPLGIRANAIGPFGVTRQSRSYLFRHGMVDPDDEKTIAHMDPGRNVSPLVVFLASDLARDITGRLLYIRPVSYSADSDIKLSEGSFTFTDAITEPIWAPETISTRLPEILRGR